MILGARLRRGATASVRGAGKLVSDALATARRAGVTGRLVVRGDSAFYAHDIVAACRRAGAHYSLAVREFPSVVTAISRIPEQAWTPIRYRNAIYDPDEQRWVTDHHGRPDPHPAAGRPGRQRRARRSAQGG